MPQTWSPGSIDCYDVISPHFWPIFNSQHRYVLMKGGRGSGKSHSAAEKFVMRAMGNPIHRLIALRKYRPYVKLSCHRLLKHYLEKFEAIYTENKADLSFTLNNGAEIMCMGLDEPEKIKSIENVTSLWVEEATEFTADDFIELDLIMRGEVPTYYQTMFTFNPVSRLNWVFKEFYENPLDNAFYHESTYRDNPFLDDFYRERLERLKDEDENYYRVYALNLWGELRATIYSKWSVKDLGLTSLRNHDFDHLLAGLDFGYNNPACFLLIGIKDKIIYVIDELYQTGLTNTDLIDRVEQKYIQWGLHYGDIEIICDNEPDRIEEFCRRGFIASPAEKQNVWSQIDFIRRLSIVINTLCPNVRKEIEGYKAKEDRRTGQVLDEPVKFMDHAMDAMRYAVYTLYAILSEGAGKMVAPIFGGESFTKGLMNGRKRGIHRSR